MTNTVKLVLAALGGAILGYGIGTTKKAAAAPAIPATPPVGSPPPLSTSLGKFDPTYSSYLDTAGRTWFRDLGSDPNFVQFSSTTLPKLFVNGPSTDSFDLFAQRMNVAKVLT